MPEPPPRPPRLRRILRLAAIVLACVALLVALAPTLLSTGPGRRYLLDLAGDRIGLHMTAGSLSLSWFGRQEVRGLAVALPDERRVGTIGTIILDQSLLNLLRNTAHIGRLRVDEAEVWTDSLASAKQAVSEAIARRPPSPPRPKQPPTLPETVEVHNLLLHAGPGAVRVTDALFQPGADKDTLRANAELAQAGWGGTAQVEVAMTGLSHDWQGPGALGIVGTLKSRRLTLEALSAIAQDLGVAIQCGGSVTADASFDRARTGEITVLATCEGSNLWATGEPLRGDRPALDAFTLRIDGKYDGRTLTVNAFELNSPVATAAASGTFAFLAQGAAPAAGQGSARMRVQVAPLAQMFPNTLGLHKDLVIEAGSVEGTVQMASDDHVAALKLVADVKDLRGRRSGKAIALSPAHLVLDVERPASEKPTDGQPPQDTLAFLKSLQVKALSIAGAFGSVEALGRLDAFTLDARFDLARAAEEAGRFVDLGGYTVGGAATIHAETSAGPDRSLQLSVRSEMKELHVGLGTGRTAAAASANIKVQVTGSLRDRLHLTAQTDFTDLDVNFGQGHRWQDPRAALGDPEGFRDPVRLSRVLCKTDLRYEGGNVRQVTLNDLDLGLAADAGAAHFKARGTLPLKGGAAEFQGQAGATVRADLAKLAETLRPFRLVPKDLVCIGQADLQVTASTEGRRLLAKVTLDGKEMDLRWPGGRYLSEPTLTAQADAALTRNDAGSVTEINLAQWRLQASAGSLSGTALLTPHPKAWAYRLTAGGQGSMEPLARTVAGLTGGSPQSIRGQWKLQGAYQVDAEGVQVIDAAASATDLVVPQQGVPPKPDIRLADARLEASATLAPDGSLDVRRAEVAGPGLALKAHGKVWLPAKDEWNFTADGEVAGRADLADLARTLAPFGLLPPRAQLAGTADFSGKVSRTADGLRGAGTLDLADLDLQFPGVEIAIQESRVHLPLALAYAWRERRWELAAEGLTSALATGALKASYIPRPGGALVEARCGLTCDAARVRALLGQRLPADVRLAGPWRISARVAGPLAPEGTWNRRLSGLTGDGAIDVARLDYDKFTGGNGTVRFRMAGGQIDLNPDPAQPSRLVVAGGTMNLAGRADLRPDIPRMIIAQPLRVLDNVPLSDEGLKEYLKFGSPILHGRIGPEGRAFVEIHTLDLALAEGRSGEAAALGRFWIDQFQTELGGPLASLAAMCGLPVRTPVQRLGPVQVRLAGGVFYIEEHQLVFSADTVMKFKGRIGLDRRMDMEVNIPLTPTMLKRFGMSADAATYLVDQRMTVPLTGTIDNPHLDEKVIAKRLGEMALEALKRRAVKDLGDLLKSGLKKH